jgi:hypothetical protein
VLKNLGKFMAKVTVGGTISKVTGGKFANGAGFAAFAAAMEAVAPGTNSNEESNKANEPSGMTTDIKDRGLDLDVVDGVIVDEIVFSCDAGTGASCAAAIESMRNVNSHEKINLTLRQVGPGESSDISLRVTDYGYDSSGNNAGEYIPVSKVARFFGAKPKIYISPTHSNPLTSFHEFGHALGLGHRPNLTRSVMSYNHLNRGGTRLNRLRDIEATRLVNHYK